MSLERRGLVRIRSPRPDPQDFPARRLTLRLPTRAAPVATHILAISCDRSISQQYAGERPVTLEPVHVIAAKFAVGRKRLIAAPKAGPSAHSYPNAAKSI